MKIGASTLYGINKQSVIESVNELEKAGFDTIELMYEHNNLLSNEEIRMLKNRKLDFSMHCPFIGVMFVHPNSSFSLPQIKLIQKSLDAAVKIGCSHYVMHGGMIPGAYLVLEPAKTRDFFIDLFIKRFRDLFKEYSGIGLKIVMENLSHDEIGGKPSDIIKIQESTLGVGFCFDIAHSEITGQTSEILKKIKIDYVHATDNNLKADQHKAIGSGKINFKKIISALKSRGFDGKIILENDLFEKCKESLNNLKRMI